MNKANMAYFGIKGVHETRSTDDPEVKAFVSGFTDVQITNDTKIGKVGEGCLYWTILT